MVYLCRGVHPPKSMMHFPLFQMSPCFPQKFQTQWKIFPILPFPRKNFRFSSAKISDDHRQQIWNFPPTFVTSIQFPLFRENYCFTPYFQNVPPVFVKFTCFFTYFVYFSFPPSLTMMHLCITECTYWTPLYLRIWILEFLKSLLLRISCWF